MIKSVTITNHLGESVKIVLSEPNPKHGMIIKQIDGLGPAKANINVTELATNDGSLFNSARLNMRNITMQILLTNAPDIETSRQRTYKYFPIKKEIEFLIELDNRIARTTCHVESNEPDIFSKDEEMSISLICEYPYFYSAGENGLNTTVFYGIEPLFEFEFENNSLEENLIEFGSIENSTAKTVKYDGDGEIGIIITIHAVGEARDISIYNTQTREHMFIDTNKIEELTGSGIVAGDTITINTMRGNKSVYLLRGGFYTNILNALRKDSDWFQLAKGDNVFAYTCEYGYENLEFKIENRVIYEGV